MKYLLLIASLLMLSACDEHYKCRNYADNIQYYQSCIDSNVCKLRASEFWDYQFKMKAYHDQCNKIDPSGAR